MAATPKASNTLVTDGTEQTLLDTPDSGVYVVTLDLTDAVANDEFELRIYMKVISGGAYVRVDTQPFGPTVPDDPGVPTIPYTALFGFKATLKQTVGTASIPWSVARLDA